MLVSVAGEVSYVTVPVIWGVYANSGITELQYNVGCQGLPGGSVVKNLSTDGGDASSIPGSGGSPGEGNSSPCLGNSMDREALCATVHGVKKESERTKKLNNNWVSEY